MNGTLQFRIPFDFDYMDHLVYFAPVLHVLDLEN